MTAEEAKEVINGVDMDKKENAVPKEKTEAPVE